MKISKKLKKKLEALKNKPDEMIDYSDIEDPDEDWLHSENWKVILPQNKKQIRINLDAEIISFFEKEGKDYQTHINDILKAYVTSHKPIH